MKPRVIHGDLLDQELDVIFNAWNRNVVPWWLLLPQGVSRAIKKRAGCAPSRELARHGPMPLGSAVLTGAGCLPLKGVIHVAGINLLWFATKRSIQDSVCSAMAIIDEHGFASVAFPIIGPGSGHRSRRQALAYMLDAFAPITLPNRGNACALPRVHADKPKPPAAPAPVPTSQQAGRLGLPCLSHAVSAEPGRPGTSAKP